MSQKFLVIQTAFIGDAILATSLLEAIHASRPAAEIHLLVRKGNEGIFSGHPFIHRVLVWDKKNDKYTGLVKLGQAIRKERFDYCINLQRFGATGILTLFSGARTSIGFDKNPFSWAFSHRIPHRIEKATHETDRNMALLAPLFGKLQAPKPKIYPAVSDHDHVAQYRQAPYICIAPASVWFTKQWPAHKWIELCGKVPSGIKIYLLGASGDHNACQHILENSANENAVNLTGKLNLLQSAALMQGAVMNYVNDSAPMHLCSAVNAPVTVIYCSTVPEFGFGPLSENSVVKEKEEKLYCRPCGLHGYKACPERHFKCAEDIIVENVLQF